MQLFAPSRLTVIGCWLLDVGCSVFPEIMFTLLQPIWLLLLIPLAAALFAWPLPARGLKILRVVVFLLVVFALAQLAIKLPDRAGTVIVVADRSESMPANSAA